VGFSDSTYINNTKVLEAEIQRVNIPENDNVTQKHTLSFRLQRKVIEPRGHI